MNNQLICGVCGHSSGISQDLIHRILLLNPGLIAPMQPDQPVALQGTSLLNRR